MKNLEERIKIDDMKEALREIFSEYGNVVDLVAKTNLKAKGQAFVVFDDIESAERAIKEVQGFELFEKSMVLDFAKTKSDATVQRQGSQDAFESHKRKRLAEKGTSPLHQGCYYFCSCMTDAEPFSQNANRPVRLQRYRRN